MQYQTKGPVSFDPVIYERTTSGRITFSERRISECALHTIFSQIVHFSDVRMNLFLLQSFGLGHCVSVSALTSPESRAKQPIGYTHY